ncbi:MAG: 2-hydroxyhepta-2,4-diene,7-dioate isomerase, fumarylacetoacetate hydrolase family [Bacteroidota bacterium]|jgi:2-keto-4-pentenoate hydratase/2-oxohepta-3-ene-1,7-dioic acid hydratase in catechol pathway
MKIIGVGKNYGENSNEKPIEPIIFTKPDTAIIRNNQDFYFPSFSKAINYEVEIVVKIDREGKNIAEKFAHKYYQEIGLGIDFTAKDLIEKYKSQGLPWDLAKGFNGSAPISDFVHKTNFENLNHIPFSLKQNGVLKQTGNTKDMFYNIDSLIAFVSQYFTLKKGDLLFTGTPAGIGEIAINDHLEAYIEDKKMLDVHVK